MDPLELKKLVNTLKTSEEEKTFMTPHNKWCKVKELLDRKTVYPRTKPRQIWWCTIGLNIGQEQSCDDGYERPVLVLKAFGGIFWGLPITSSDPAGTKAKNPLYFKIDGMPYINERGKQKVLHGFVAIHQLRVFDGRRLKRKILKIDVETFEKITAKIKDIL